MKIRVEIVMDENEWKSRERAGKGPFAVTLSNEGVMDSLSARIFEWLGGVKNAVHVEEVKPTERIAAGTLRADAIRELEARVIAMEEWAARACGDWSFNSDSRIDVRELYDFDALNDRLSDLERSASEGPTLG